MATVSLVISIKLLFVKYGMKMKQLPLYGRGKALIKNPITLFCLSVQF